MKFILGLACPHYLLAVGILVDLQLGDQAAGSLQCLEVVVRGRVYPCLPWEVLPLVDLPFDGLPLVDLPLVGLPFACLLGVTAALEASEAGPSLEEEMFEKAAGLQNLFEEEEERHVWDLGLEKKGDFIMP